MHTISTAKTKRRSTWTLLSLSIIPTIVVYLDTIMGTFAISNLSKHL